MCRAAALALKSTTALHCKNIRRPYIRGYFVASFPYFNEPVPYTSVSVNRRNNERNVGVRFTRRFTDTDVYETVVFKM